MKSMKLLGAGAALFLMAVMPQGMAAEAAVKKGPAEQLDELTALKIEIEKLRRNLVTPQAIDESAANAVERRDSQIRASTEARLAAFETLVRRMVEEGVAARLEDFKKTAATISASQMTLQKSTDAATAKVEVLSRDAFGLRTATDSLGSRVVSLEAMKAGEAIKGLRTEVDSLKGKTEGSAERIRFIEDKGIGGLSTRLASLTDKQQVDSASAQARMVAIEKNVAMQMAGLESVRSDGSALSAVVRRIDAVEKAQQSQKEVNLSGIVERFSEMEAAVRDAQKPVVDVSGIEKRIDAVEKAQKSQKQVDLTGIVERFSEMESAVRAAQKPVSVDVSGIEKRVAAMEKVQLTQKPVDVSGIVERLSAAEAAVRAAPKPMAVDLSGIEKRIASIEARVRDGGKADASEIRSSNAALQAEIARVKSDMARRTQEDAAGARSAAAAVVDEKLIIFANEMGSQLKPVRAQSEQASKDVKNLRDENYTVLADQVRSLIARLDSIERSLGAPGYR